MKIELCGLPGSGKTTFAKALKNNTFKVIEVSKLEIFFFNIVAFFLNPITYIALFKFIFGCSRGPLFKEKVINLFLIPQAKFIKSSFYKNTIIDQGFFHSVIGLFDHEVEINTLEKYLKLIPKNYTVFFFDFSSEERRKNIQKRNKHPRPLLPTDARDNWLCNAEKNFINLLKYKNVFSDFVISSREDFNFHKNRLLKFLPVYFVLSTRYPTEKAYGNQTTEMALAFARHGFSVQILAPDRLRKKIDPFQFYDVPRVFDVTLLKSGHFFLQKIGKKYGFLFERLIYFFVLLFKEFPKNALIYTRSPELVFLFSLKKLKTIYECHDWFERKVFFQVTLIRFANKIVTTNHYIKNKFLNYNLAQEKIIIAPNGVDDALFANHFEKEDAFAKIQKQLNLVFSHKNFILFYSGSLKTKGYEKGVKEIITSLQYLPKEIIFLAVGGDDNDISYYIKLAHVLKVSDRVFFYPRVEKKTLAIFQQVADVLMMPFPKIAHYEYFMSPLKSFEYMAAKRPIIVSNLPSLREIFNDHEALFVHPGDAQDLAEKILLLYNDSTLRNQFAQNSFEKVQDYTWEARAQKIISTL